MKKSLKYIFILLLSPLFVIGQNNINLNIHHKLGDEAFELNKPAKNNLNQDFKVKRMQYYLCDFTIVHDGGTETPMKTVWILANAAETTSTNLGAYDINTVEGIKFSIGVEPEYNHLDPAAYDADHPLAPKVPSMHWGWASGYRFVAFEGFGGNTFTRNFELHGLGDDNLFTVEIEASGITNGNNITINLDADYTRALENIDVEAGVIVHGEDLEAQECLENMRDFVFSASDITNNIFDVQNVDFNLYPNPVSGDLVTVEFDKDLIGVTEISIRSIDGQLISEVSNLKSGKKVDVSHLKTGYYTVSLKSEGKVVSSKKLFIR